MRVCVLPVCRWHLWHVCALTCALSCVCQWRACPFREEHVCAKYVCVILACLMHVLALFCGRSHLRLRPHTHLRIHHRNLRHIRFPDLHHNLRHHNPHPTLIPVHRNHNLRFHNSGLLVPHLKKNPCCFATLY